jgi:hypothetical protein
MRYFFLTFSTIHITDLLGLTSASYYVCYSTWFPQGAHTNILQGESLDPFSRGSLLYDNR